MLPQNIILVWGEGLNRRGGQGWIKQNSIWGGRGGVKHNALMQKKAMHSRERLLNTARLPSPYERCRTNYQTDRWGLPFINYAAPTNLGHNIITPNETINQT